MEDNNKVYAFTITMYEFERTIPTLWGHVRDFVDRHPEYVVEDNAMGFQSDNGGLNYNLCHCASSILLVSSSRFLTTGQFGVTLRSPI